MKWLIDLNVLLDVIQQRAPFFDSSAQIISKTVQGEATGFIAGHEVTTVHPFRPSHLLICWFYKRRRTIASSERSSEFTLAAYAT